MTAYVLAQISIHDRARYDAYIARFMPVLKRHSGALLVADEAPEIVEGDWRHQKVILLAFEDADAARAWMNSTDYREIAVDRLASTAATVLLLEGVGPRSG